MAWPRPSWPTPPPPLGMGTHVSLVSLGGPPADQTVLCPCRQTLACAVSLQGLPVQASQHVLAPALLSPSGLLGVHFLFLTWGPTPLTPLPLGAWLFHLPSLHSSRCSNQDPWGRMKMF